MMLIEALTFAHKVLYAFSKLSALVKYASEKITQPPFNVIKVVCGNGIEICDQIIKELDKLKNMLIKNDINMDWTIREMYKNMSTSQQIILALKNFESRFYKLYKRVSTLVVSIEGVFFYTETLKHMQPAISNASLKSYESKVELDELMKLGR
jgi:hypothetical protein